MTTPAALVLAGGLSLGAYQAGAIRTLLESGRVEITALAGSSIGAINAAIFAGNAPERRVERLLAFWAERSAGPGGREWLDPLGVTASGPFRHASNWASALATRASGARGMFAPGPSVGALPGGVPSLYHTDEMTATLARFVDFDRLNAGDMRLCIATTDIETAEAVVFDTAAGDRIGPEHLLASGGLLPNFQPVEIGGRWLADGGLSVNAPLEPLLASNAVSTPRTCFLLDLFAPDQPAPTTLEGVAARATDLQFASQTQLRLQGLQRERALSALGGTDLFYLSHRPSPDDALPEKQFDFSRATIEDRIRDGARDAEEALRILGDIAASPERGLRVHRVRRSDKRL